MKTLGEAYNKFQHDYGQHISLDYNAIIESLFSDNFKKIANGVELVNGRHNLLSQLESIKNAAGSWSIDVREIIVSACNQKLINSYVIESEKLGKFGVIAIIHCDEEQKIHSIHVVYYQF